MAVYRPGKPSFPEGFTALYLLNFSFFSKCTLKTQAERLESQSRKPVITYIFRDKASLSLCCVGFLPSPHPCWPAELGE